VARWDRAGEAVRYDVFDGAGNLVAGVQLGAARRIVEIGASHVYVARTDSDDLQWLERYPLPTSLRVQRGSAALLLTEPAAGVSRAMSLSTPRALTADTASSASAPVPFNATSRCADDTTSVCHPLL